MRRGGTKTPGDIESRPMTGLKWEKRGMAASVIPIFDSSVLFPSTLERKSFAEAKKAQTYHKLSESFLSGRQEIQILVHCLEVGETTSRIRYHLSFGPTGRKDVSPGRRNLRPDEVPSKSLRPGLESNPVPSKVASPFSLISYQFGSDPGCYNRIFYRY